MIVQELGLEGKAVPQLDTLVTLLRRYGSLIRKVTFPWFAPSDGHLPEYLVAYALVVRSTPDLTWISRMPSRLAAVVESSSAPLQSLTRLDLALDEAADAGHLAVFISGCPNLIQMKITFNALLQLPSSPP